MYNIEHYIDIYVADYAKRNQYHKLLYWQ